MIVKRISNTGNADHEHWISVSDLIHVGVRGRPPIRRSKSASDQKILEHDVNLRRTDIRKGKKPPSRRASDFTDTQ